METIASRYAESLFALAREEDKIEAYDKDIDFVSSVFSSDPSFVPFFSHVLIEDAVKFNLLDKCFKGQIDSYVCNFLKLLVKKRRMRYIADICNAFKILCNEYHGIVEGILYSSFDLSEEEIHKIEKAVSTKENKNVQLRLELDKTLIGGIKIQIGNQIIDASIKNKLESLKKELLRK